MCVIGNKPVHDHVTDRKTLAFFHLRIVQRQHIGKEFGRRSGEGKRTKNAIKQEGKITFTAQLLFVVKARFFVQHAPTEYQIIILIHSDDRLHSFNQSISRMIWINREFKASGFVQFQFDGRVKDLQAFKVAVIDGQAITINTIYHHRSPSCHVNVIVPVPVTVTSFSPSVSSSSGNV